MNQMSSGGRCGYVALVGRPNVGKSTLLNRLVGQKISITSSKPQTTRHCIMGIKTHTSAQIIYVDTPGLHLDVKRTINRHMNRIAMETLRHVDVIVFLVEALCWKDEDDYTLELLRDAAIPILLAINKVDQLTRYNELLPYIQKILVTCEFSDIFPISARKNRNIDALEGALISLLPEGEPVFPSDQITDRSERFLAAELVREKLLRRLGAEVPYRLAVEIEQFEEEGGLIRISALIWVERPGQKAIVIGKQGRLLKAVGILARQELESILERKVFLQLWVKVREAWSDDERSLQQLGYIL